MRACFAFVLIMTALLTGCVSVPPGSKIIQKQAQGLRAPEGYGAIYVFRPRMPPGDTLWGVNLDAKHFGYLAPGFYLYGFVSPGEHSLDLEYPQSTIHFTVGRGQNNYFRISMGFPGMRLTPIEPNDAKELVFDYTLSSLNIFENDNVRKLLDDSMPSK